MTTNTKREENEVSICCEVERSGIYPRDCSRCGGLFIPKNLKEKKQKNNKWYRDIINLIQSKRE